MGFQESFLSAGKVKKQISKAGSCVPWRPWVLLWECMRPGALVSVLRSWSETWGQKPRCGGNRGKRWAEPGHQTNCSIIGIFVPRGGMLILFLYWLSWVCCYLKLKTSWLIRLHLTSMQASLPLPVLLLSLGHQFQTSFLLRRGWVFNEILIIHHVCLLLTKCLVKVRLLISSCGIEQC